jgi:hypothetical protein
MRQKIQFRKNVHTRKRQKCQKTVEVIVKKCLNPKKLYKIFRKELKHRNLRRPFILMIQKVAYY